jgi:hypothetical protein
LTPLFQAAWPACWKSYSVCNVQWVNAVAYLEVVGIICGQILVGIIGDGYDLASAPSQILDANLLPVSDVAGVSFRMP